MNDSRLSALKWFWGAKEHWRRAVAVSRTLSRAAPLPHFTTGLSSKQAGKENINCRMLKAQKWWRALALGRRCWRWRRGWRMELNCL